MNTVTQLHTDQPPGVELVDSAELALLREQARLSARLCIAVYNRRRRGCFVVPMRYVEPLAAALLKGRA
jgi:hypothetical protein